MIPATEKVIKPRLYRIYGQKTGNCFWLVSYTRSKIPFICSGSELQIFKYPQFERTLCTDTYGINFVYQKMELRETNPYLWTNKIIMMLEHVEIFVRTTTSEIWRCCIVNTRLESQRWKHNIVTTLVFGRSNDVGNTTL